MTYDKPLVIERSFSFSPGPTNDTGPHKEFARSCHVQVVATTSTHSDTARIPEAHTLLLREVQEMQDAATRFLEGELRAGGYRFQKKEEKPRVSEPAGHRWDWLPLASANIAYEFYAPTEKWTEQRGDQEVWLRGVHDPFPNVPLTFLQGLRDGLHRAVGARFEGQWDFGEWNLRRMAARVAEKHLARTPDVRVEGVKVSFHTVDEWHSTDLHVTLHHPPTGNFAEPAVKAWLQSHWDEVVSRAPWKPPAPAPEYYSDGHYGGWDDDEDEDDEVDTSEQPKPGLGWLNPQHETLRTAESVTVKYLRDGVTQVYVGWSHR